MKPPLRGCWLPNRLSLSVQRVRQARIIALVPLQATCIHARQSLAGRCGIASRIKVAWSTTSSAVAAGTVRVLRSMVGGQAR